MLTPLYDRVIVKRAEAEAKTKSGLFLPNSAQDKPTAGEVVASASDQVAVGDTVYFGEYSGSKVSYEGTDFLIIKADDLLGKISKNA
jgi:chaperonin GroES